MREYSVRFKISISLIIAGAVLFLFGLLILTSKPPKSYFELEKYEYTAQSSDIKSVDINIGYGEVRIVSGTSFKMKCENVDKDRFEYKISSNVLTINYDVDRIESMYMGKGKGIDTVFEITLPNKLLEEVSFSQIKGSADIKGISCNRLDIVSEMSDITFNGVTVNHDTSLDMGSGSCKFTSCTLERPNIKGGSGDIVFMSSRISNMTYDGQLGDLDVTGCILTGSSKLITGASDVRLHLLSGENSYGFSFDKGRGDITVAGKSYKEYDTKAGENNIYIDNGFGNVTISFG